MFTNILITFSAAAKRVAFIPLTVAFVLVSTGTMDQVVTNTLSAVEAFQTFNDVANR